MKTKLSIPACVALTLLAGPITVGADPGTPQENPLATIPTGVVDGETARRLAGAGAVVVDVRTPREFDAGHVPGARNIPHDQIASRAAEIGSPETPVVLYCRSGTRTAIAGDALRKLGFRRIWDLQRYDAWPRADQR